MAVLMTSKQSNQSGKKKKKAIQINQSATPRLLVYSKQIGHQEVIL